MMYSVAWSPEAKEDYWENIDYLLKNFTVVEAQFFIDEVENYIKIISNNPLTFQSTGFKKVHAVPLVPQVTLYYSYNKDEVFLLRFWNNYKEPRKLKL